MFRRRRDSEGTRDADDELVDREQPAEDAEPPAPMRPQGPWDEQDVPDDDVPRLDIGSLRVPVSPAIEVRLELDEGNQVVGATFVVGASAMQVNVFAAPKTTGIWADVRAELLASLRESGGGADEADGPFGPELRARLVQPGGAPAQPARFVGVDGPRWFLRGVFTGPAANDPDQARPLDAAMRQVVVVRGKEAMAPRDGLPLRLPREAQASGGEDEGVQPEGTPASDQLRPFERGPEITERR
ncbi:MAG: DUF3710 domain-containing protein [Actinomycetota bacterium]|nr:DUF3710 domain-containing protein [Actinomycetota bacterium]